MRVGIEEARYVPYGEFANYIASQVDLPEGSQKQILSIRRALWYANDVNKRDKIDTDLINGEPHIRTTKKNIAAFVSIYKEWQSKAKERRQKIPVEFSWSKSGLENRIITGRRFSRRKRR